jgi:Fic family protein
MPDPVLALHHDVDRVAGGALTTREPIVNRETRDRYIQSSLIEEAITSSQLEGAATTREVAKEMIRSGRKPADTSERMILNNYRAIRLIGKLKDEPLTPAVVFELWRTIVDGTVEVRGGGELLRKPGDRIAVYDETDNTLLHDPPPAEQLPRRLQAMCDFANEAETGVFLHPALKAVILHFWLAHDHPFVDGNGRTARALFYWSMLSQGFWLFEFISISRILRTMPSRYGRSFLYSETDENDLTYFILSQLDVIRRAFGELRQYLDRKTQEVRETESLLRSSAILNHRQLALLGHAMRHPGMRYTIESHQRSHDVTYQTARTDLLDLAAKTLLTQGKAGRRFVFSAPADLAERLRKAS